MLLKKVFQVLFVVPVFTLAVVMAVMCSVLIDLVAPARSRPAKRGQP